MPELDLELLAEAKDCVRGDRLRELDPRLDVIAADAHFGYYRARSVVNRLHEDNGVFQTHPLGIDWILVSKTNWKNLPR